MRPRTLVAVLGIAVALAGAAFVALGGFSGFGDAGLTVEWASDTERDVRVNHHELVAASIDGSGFVFAPVSGADNTTDCSLFALDARDGEQLWTHDVPRKDCTIHAVADPALGDIDGDGTREVFVATTERRVTGFDVASGDQIFVYDLTSYGYSKPLVTDFVGDDGPEVVVVDAKGTVSVVHGNGTAAWTRQLEAFTWGQPAVADFDADGERELVVGVAGEGTLHLFERDGSLAWQRTNATDTSITWLTSTQLDGDAAREVVVATQGGRVVAYDGRDGSVEWTRDFESFAAVHAVGEGAIDGDSRVYATAKDGVLRALSPTTGETEWTATLTTADVQMMPAPSLGDVDDDGEAELVATTNDGMVTVVDPGSGDVEDTYSRDVPIYTKPHLADTDGDGAPEVYVMYSDGRVVALAAN
jgi:outer membrane protein assembly factor BamB